MNEKTSPSTKRKLDELNKREEKILRILREERSIVEKRFPLVYALVATFGVAATLSGINQLIQRVEFLQNNPLALIAIGLLILIGTGTAYKKLA